MTLPKFIVLVISFALALVASGAFAAIGVANGGAGQMIIVIFLTVGFKATIEYFLPKRRKKREAGRIEKPSP